MGNFNGVREFGRRFRERGKPCWIVNTGSHNALGAPSSGVCTYVAPSTRCWASQRSGGPTMRVAISGLASSARARSTPRSGAGRNRSEEYGGTYGGDPANEQFLEQVGLDPAKVGQMVVAAVKASDVYIFTHAEDIALGEKRYQEARGCMERQWPQGA